MRPNASRVLAGLLAAAMLQGCVEVPVLSVSSDTVPRISVAEARAGLAAVSPFSVLYGGHVAFNDCGMKGGRDGLNLVCQSHGSFACPYGSLRDGSVTLAGGGYHVDLRPECNVFITFLTEASAASFVNALYVMKHPADFPQDPSSPAPLAAAPAPAPAPQARPEAAPASDVDEPSYKSAAPRPDDFALLIGISKYRDIPEAQFAEKDVRAVKRHLLAMGYPEENIVSLLGDHATNSSIAEKLERWFPMNVSAASTVFVYYSGHGAPDPESKQAYLVPWDGQPGDLADTAFPLARFYKDLQKLPAKRVLVALDSCFSGAGGRSVLAKGARPLVTRVDAAVPQDGKLVVFTASQADQISGTLEDQGHGAFTYYFLKGLDGEASDGSGRVTAGSLYGYLAKRVSAAAHRQEREQNPQLLPSVEASGAVPLR